MEGESYHEEGRRRLEEAEAEAAEAEFEKDASGTVAQLSYVAFLLNRNYVLK